MRKTVAITMDKDLWIKTRKYLLHQENYNLSKFIESLITDHLDANSRIQNQKKIKKGVEND